MWKDSVLDRWSWGSSFLVDRKCYLQQEQVYKWDNFPVFYNQFL